MKAGNHSGPNSINFAISVSKLMKLTMKKHHRAVILSLALLFTCAGLTNAFAKPTITGIRLETPSPSTDQVIFEMNGPYLPSGKPLPGDNPRVYFDFPGAEPSSNVKNRIPVNGNFVKQIRYAYHKDADEKTRVVLDLRSDIKMEFKQDFNPNTNTLIISLYLAGTQPEPAAAAKPAKPEPQPAPEPQPVKPVVTLKPAKPAPEPEPEPAAVAQPVEPKPIATPKPPPSKPAAVVEPPKPEPEPVKAPAQKIQQPIQSVSITPTEQPKQYAPPPQPEPVAAKTPKPEPKPEPAPDKIASIIPSSKIPAPAKEATDIKPMAEVGEQAEESGDAIPVLNAIEFEPNNQRGEIISFNLNGFYPPVVFGIEEDIPRIVCFFKNTVAGSNLKDTLQTNGQYVSNIQVGKYQNPDNIRVVLELAPSYNYDLQQIFFKDEKVFMLIINKAGKQGASAAN